MSQMHPMAELTPDDARRWDADSVLKVFQVAKGRAATLQRFGDDLGQVGQQLAEWHGEAGEAFHADLGRARSMKPPKVWVSLSPRTGTWTSATPDC